MRGRKIVNRGNSVKQRPSLLERWSSGSFREEVGVAIHAGVGGLGGLQRQQGISEEIKQSMIGLHLIKSILKSAWGII